MRHQTKVVGRSQTDRTEIVFNNRSDPVGNARTASFGYSVYLILLYLILLISAKADRPLVDGFSHRVINVDHVAGQLMGR